MEIPDLPEPPDLAALRALHAGAQTLAADAGGSTAARLTNSVVRPLDALLGPDRSAHETAPEEPLTLRELARSATAMRIGSTPAPELLEATAWYVDFHDPAPDPDASPTVFEWMGAPTDAINSIVSVLSM